MRTAYVKGALYLDIEGDRLALIPDGDQMLVEVSNPGDPRQAAGIILERHHVEMLRDKMTERLEEEGHE